MHSERETGGEKGKYPQRKTGTEKMRKRDKETRWKSAIDKE
jgi:hypothetical protein